MTLLKELRNGSLFALVYVESEFLEALWFLCRPNLVMRNASFFSDALASRPPSLYPEEFSHFKAAPLFRLTQPPALTLQNYFQNQRTSGTFFHVKLFWVMTGQSSSHTYIPPTAHRHTHLYHIPLLYAYISLIHSLHSLDKIFKK